MKFNILHGRKFADLLTLSRAILGFTIAGLGLSRGSEALPSAISLVLLSWVTDTLDGPLARSDSEGSVSWIGKHDAEADLATSVGVTGFLVFSGFLSGWVGIGIVAAMIGTWFLHSYQLAWPLYAVPYVFLGDTAFREEASVIWLAIAYLAFTLVLHWARMRDEFLPEFFRAVGSLFSGK